MRLRDSRLGRAWIAIREDETAAAAMGVPLMRTKTWAYAGGAFFGGIAGAYFGSFKSGTFPDDLLQHLRVHPCMVILSMGSIWGVVLGGAFSYLDREGLGTSAAAEREPRHHYRHPQVLFGIYGAIIVIVMLFRPQGLVPEARHKLEFEEGLGSASTTSPPRAPDVERS